MLATPSPLTEKMTLFWHNHFVSSQQKVRSPQLMYRQNALLRRHALGNFGELLHAVARDPAMVVYLDSASNRKGQPNENFAREVMELFTLGEGNYAEQRHQGSGARLHRLEHQPRDRASSCSARAQHDDGVKTVLGRTGNFDGDAVLDILLAQPQTAEFIVAQAVARVRLAAARPGRGEAHRAPSSASPATTSGPRCARCSSRTRSMRRQNRAALIKSPVDLVVGTLRQFSFTTGDVMPFVFTASQLGQDAVRPAQRQGLAGRRSLDQFDDAARAQGVPRAPVPGRGAAAACWPRR